jgi:hypothetical protein
MLTDVLLGGVKKFGDLVLVHPDHAVFGVQRNRGLAVNGVIDDNVTFLAFHSVSFSTIYS